MKIYKRLVETIDKDRFKKWSNILSHQIRNAMDVSTNSNLSKWLSNYESLSILPCCKPVIDNGMIVFEDKNIPLFNKNKLENQLMKFCPWRKGPYQIHGIHLDAEWRSNLKWDRLKSHISSLKGKTVLDIGSSNGYHGFRMLQDGADFIIGMDSFMLNVMQFHVINHFSSVEPLFVLPLAIEQLPSNMEAFDSVFSMGVLYHVRSPMDHLIQIKESLVQNGELILETLIIEGKSGEILVPFKRYAKMRNVWFIPTTLTLELWLKRIGFTDIRLIDISKTTSYEQRKTRWMPFESLGDFLDQKNPEKTIEGYPAPKRAIFIAKKK